MERREVQRAAAARLGGWLALRSAVRRWSVRSWASIIAFIVEGEIIECLSGVRCGHVPSYAAPGARSTQFCTPAMTTSSHSRGYAGAEVTTADRHADARDALLRQLVTSGTRRRYRPGDALFLEGDRSDRMLLIESGAVKVTCSTRGERRDARGLRAGRAARRDVDPRRRAPLRDRPGARRGRGNLRSPPASCSASCAPTRRPAWRCCGSSPPACGTPIASGSSSRRSTPSAGWRPGSSSCASASAGRPRRHPRGARAVAGRSRCVVGCVATGDGEGARDTARTRCPGDRAPRPDRARSRSPEASRFLNSAVTPRLLAL